MAIDSNFRRQGYGTKLLHAGELFAKMAGEEQIFLHVRYVSLYVVPYEKYTRASTHTHTKTYSLMFCKARHAVSII
jgi:GNAT superfamily N-acetyltransferase